MKIIAYFIALTFAHCAVAQSTDGGFVGLTLSSTAVGLITGITPDSPATNSPIHVGDRIVPFDSVPVSHIHGIADLRKATSGVPLSQIELKVRPAHSSATIRVRLRRISPRKIPPDFNRYQVSSDTNGLTSDAANRWPLRVPAFDDFHIQPAATRSLASGH